MRFAGEARFGLYGDVVAEIDWSVGVVLGTLKRLNLDSNTLVISSSDNGPWFQGSPGRQHGRKQITWDGSVRAPWMARMPGRIPAGRIFNGIAYHIDVFPTATHLCNAPRPPNPLDSTDIWPLLSGQAAALDREPILFFESMNLQAVRWRNWKLHLTCYNTIPDSPPPREDGISLPLRPVELYDIEGDPDESYDVVERQLEVVKEILARVDARMKTLPEEVQRIHAETMRRAIELHRPGSVPQPARGRQ